MTDDFTAAATAEARRESPLYDNEVLSYGVRMAEWARDHLAAQEPTDAEAEAAARAIHINTIREFDDLGGLDQHALRVRARKALTAARKARA